MRQTGSFNDRLSGFMTGVLFWLGLSITMAPIVLKFCTVDYVGETTKHAKNGYNRLARGGSPYR
jgi:hypothetical protein